MMYNKRQTLVKAADDMWWLSPVDKGYGARPIAIACEGTVGKVTSKVRLCSGEKGESERNCTSSSSPSRFFR